MASTRRAAIDLPDSDEEMVAEIAAGVPLWRPFCVRRALWTVRQKLTSAYT